MKDNYSKIDGFDRNQDLILFFTPEAEVHSHLVGQCIVAKNLALLGYKTAFVFCPGIFCRCPAMDCHALPHAADEQSKRAICFGCVNKFAQIMNHYQFSWIDLKTVISTGMLDLAQKLVEGSAHDIFNLKYEDIPFGKIAYGDYAIESKRWQPDNLNEEGLSACKGYAHSSIVSYLAISKIIEELPVKILTRFNDYANNMGAYFAAKKKNVQVLTISYASHFGGVDRRRILVLPKLWSAIQQDQIKQWPLWRDLPLQPKVVKEIATDSMMRLNSSSEFVFSSSRKSNTIEIRQQLNLNPNKKCLVAFTSSPDERYFSKQLLSLVDQDYPDCEQAFSDHVDWLKFLIHYVENSLDLELVIRIHPREGKNKRYPKISQNYELLLKEFGNQNFQNCRIIWPEDSISSYNLMEFADLGLTSWSSIGLEMARLGIPVVTAFKNMSFPSDDFHLWGGGTPEEYANTIRKQLQRGVDFNDLKLSYRCYNLFQLSYSIFVEDQVPSANFDNIPIITKASNAIDGIEQVIVNKVNAADYARAKAIKELNSKSYTCESTEIIRQIKRLVVFLCLGRDQAEEFCVNILNDSCSPIKNEFNICEFENGMIQYRSELLNGEIYSPLCARLVKLLQKSDFTKKEEGDGFL